jgi:hypothetical protein
MLTHSINIHYSEIYSTVDTCVCVQRGAGLHGYTFIYTHIYIVDDEGLAYFLTELFVAADEDHRCTLD